MLNGSCLLAKIRTDFFASHDPISGFERHERSGFVGAVRLPLLREPKVTLWSKDAASRPGIDLNLTQIN